MTKKRPKRLDYQTYFDERKELYKYQQAAYDSFEKTLTALVGSFLAFSVGFLGFLPKSSPERTSELLGESAFLMIGSWMAFSLSLGCLLMCFFVNAKAYTVEITALEAALEDIAALDKPNSWRPLSIVLYSVSTLGFFVGLALLLLFCHRSIFV